MGLTGMLVGSEDVMCRSPLLFSVCLFCALSSHFLRHSDLGPLDHFEREQRGVRSDRFRVFYPGVAAAAHLPSSRARRM